MELPKKAGTAEAKNVYYCFATLGLPSMSMSYLTLSKVASFDDCIRQKKM